MPKGVKGSGGVCGEYSGVNKHRREGTKLCDACRQANREYRAKWQEEYPESAARAEDRKRVLMRARSKALNALRWRYSDEFDQLYRAALSDALKGSAVPQPACQGDGVCTNPRCPTHGIEWDGA